MQQNKIKHHRWQLEDFLFNVILAYVPVNDFCSSEPNSEWKDLMMIFAVAGSFKPAMLHACMELHAHTPGGQIGTTDCCQSESPS